MVMNTNINKNAIPVMKAELEKLKKEEKEANNIVSKIAINCKINKLENNIMRESAKKY